MTVSPVVPHSAAAKSVHEEDLSDVLCEFDAVLEDLTSPQEKRRFRYDEHLKTMKRMSSASVSDSGISDSESKPVHDSLTDRPPFSASPVSLGGNRRNTSKVVVFFFQKQNTIKFRIVMRGH